MRKLYTFGWAVLLLALLTLQNTFATPKKSVVETLSHSIADNRWVENKLIISPQMQQVILVNKGSPEISLEIYYIPHNTLAISQLWQQIIDYIGNSDCQLQSGSELIHEKNKYYFLFYLNQCSNNRALKQFYRVSVRDTQLYMSVLSINPDKLSLQQQNNLLRKLNIYNQEAFF